MTLDLATLYAASGTAKLADLPTYEARAKKLVPPWAEVTMTGPAPIWLYLRVAHSLHGWVKTLVYHSPVTGPVQIFDHDAG